MQLLRPCVAGSLGYDFFSILVVVGILELFDEVKGVNIISGGNKTQDYILGFPNAIELRRFIHEMSSFQLFRSLYNLSNTRSWRWYAGESFTILPLTSTQAWLENGAGR